MSEEDDPAKFQRDLKRMVSLLGMGRTAIIMDYKEDKLTKILYAFNNADDPSESVTSSESDTSANDDLSAQTTGYDAFARPDGVKSSQVKSSQVNSSQVKSSQVKSSQVKSSQGACADEAAGEGCDWRAGDKAALYRHYCSILNSLTRRLGAVDGISRLECVAIALDDTIVELKTLLTADELKTLLYADKLKTS
jgi:hypothetical protein